MLIRTALTTDAQALAGLVTSLAGYFQDDPSQALPAWFSDTLTPDAFNARLSSDKQLNLVVEIDGSIAAYLSLQKPDYLYHLFVAEAFHGRGLARQLWQRAMVLCPAERYLVRSSLYSVPVYQKLGFVAHGEVGHRDGISYQPMEFFSLKPSGQQPQSS
ncbi:GNAT family N-acetyltransferase [Shewanella sedimentimangrovi]|uniref:GNAT family N-acetyltransferase n=1 Tax=Shewanella sedimentimangrovi TaxID=2814293 RepID=A0ABX7QYH2_9GAMM|nr:GNAT family N-acetyltransferase [Shewanella sedimentimangrovi]QSX36571.1 GNAT family N-acetyltransferase [Shewanella sedimentimangrovi]